MPFGNSKVDNVPVNGRLKCYRCGTYKDAQCFYVAPKTTRGYRGRCKECDITEINNRHNSNLDRALRNLCIAHKTNGRHGSKRRQKFTAEGCVTPDVLRELWELQDGRCAVTAIPMTHIQGAGFRVWTNVTVDRINPDVGYLRDNIRLVCRAVNYMKAAMSDAEMLQWAVSILNGPLANRSVVSLRSFTAEAAGKLPEHPTQFL